MTGSPFAHSPAALLSVTQRGVPMSKVITVRLDDELFTAVERIRRRVRRPRNAILKEALSIYTLLREKSASDSELYEATRKIRRQALREIAVLDGVQDLAE